MYAADWPKLPHFSVAPDKDNQNAPGFQDLSQSEAYMVLCLVLLLGVSHFDGFERGIGRYC